MHETITCVYNTLRLRMYKLDLKVELSCKRDMSYDLRVRGRIWLAARSPGGGGCGGGRSGAGSPRHGGELVGGGGVWRALLPRPALHHKAGVRR